MSGRGLPPNRYYELVALTAAVNDDCILWEHRVGQNGYGTLRLGMKNKGAHRVSCEIHHGPPPRPDSQASHSCHVRNCINPRHLRWATPKENIADRTARGTTQRGEGVGTSRLKERDVIEIRALAAQGEQLRRIASMYGVHEVTVGAVVKRETWKHIPPGASLGTLGAEEATLFAATCRAYVGGMLAFDFTSGKPTLVEVK